MSQTNAPASNRRSSARRKPKTTAKVTCVGGTMGIGPNLALSMLDVSETGIRLVLKKAAAVGQEVEVGLEGVGDHRPAKVAARVIWCAALADGSYCIGARFLKALPYGLLHALAYL